MSSRWTTAARASGLWRFLAAGADDAVVRLARLTDRQPPDETAMVRAVEASRVVAWVERVVDAVSAAAPTSAVVHVATIGREAWLGQPLVARTRGTGGVLLTAALVHVALDVWQGPPPGWLWLVIPTLAAAFGTLLAVAPRRGFPDRPAR